MISCPVQRLDRGPWRMVVHLDITPPGIPHVEVSLWTYPAREWTFSAFISKGFGWKIYPSVTGWAAPLETWPPDFLNYLAAFRLEDYLPGGPFAQFHMQAPKEKKHA